MTKTEHVILLETMSKRHTIRFLKLRTSVCRFPSCFAPISKHFSNPWFHLIHVNQRVIGRPIYSPTHCPTPINKSEGPEGIHPKILHETRYEIAFPLQILFDNSIKTHQVPMDWRTANISPKFKKSKKLNASNYRPISITSLVSTLLESLIRDHVVDYFSINNLFHTNQYGLVKGKSTVTQLLKILENSTELLEEGGQIDVMCTDFEKAFDRVPHKRLISKLNSYNIDTYLIN